MLQRKVDHLDDGEEWRYGIRFVLRLISYTGCRRRHAGSRGKGSALLAE